MFHVLNRGEGRMDRQLPIPLHRPRSGPRNPDAPVAGMPMYGVDPDSFGGDNLAEMAVRIKAA